MDLSPESRKAEESLEEQKDEFQREPKAELLSAGISAELVVTTGCDWAAFVSLPLPVALVGGAALNPGTRTLVSEPGPARPRGVPWELAGGDTSVRGHGPRVAAGRAAPGWSRRGAAPLGRAERAVPPGAEAEEARGPPGTAVRAPPFLPPAAQGLGRGDSGNGERLRLRFQLRRRRRGEAGPGAHHGAGEGADRRGQRTGTLAADDGQVLSEVHREARRRPGQLRAEVHRHVHGPVHGLLEHSFASLQFSAAAGESQHVTPAGLRAEKGPCGEGTAASPGG